MMPVLIVAGLGRWSSLDTAAAAAVIQRRSPRCTPDLFTELTMALEHEPPGIVL